MHLEFRVAVVLAVGLEYKTVVIVGSRSIYCPIGSRIVNSILDPSNSVESVFLVATRSYIIFVSVCVPDFIPLCY